MSFKIADAYVAVLGDTSGLAADLKPKISAVVKELSGAESVQVPVHADVADFERQLVEGVAAADTAAKGEIAVPVHADTSTLGKEVLAGVTAVMKPGGTTAVEVEKEAHDAGTLFGGAFGIAVSQQAVYKLQDSLPNIFRSVEDTGVKSGAMELGRAFGVKFSDEAAANMRFGEVFKAMPVAVEKAATEATQAVEEIARESTQAVEEAVDEAAPEIQAKIEKPIKDAAKNGGNNLSGLLIGAFTAAATIGPAAVLTATGAAVVGASALINKSNKQLAADTTALGKEVEAELVSASQPMISGLEAGLTTLETGAQKLGPELSGVFAAAAPYANEIAASLVAFATDVLPGVTAGLKDMAPVMSTIATDAGDIGSGIGGLISGLGGGAAGSATGLTALSQILDQLLPEVGQITGDLANGLGPALHDVSTVALPVASALTAVVNAVPPGVIRTAADAVTGLYVAFKIGSMTNLIADGTKFSTWAGSILPAAANQAKISISGFTTAVGVLNTVEDETSGTQLIQSLTTTGAAAKVATGEAAAGAAEAGGAAEGMGGSWGKTLPIIGAVIGAAGLLGDQLGKLSGVGMQTGSVPELSVVLADAASGSTAASQEMTGLAAAMAIVGQVSTSQAAAGLTNVDTALAQMYATDPKQATADFNSMSAAMQANGLSTAQITALFPQYTGAVQSATAATTENTAAQTAAVSSVQTFTGAVENQIKSLETQAYTQLINTTAANEALGPQAQLSDAAVTAENAYQQAASATSAYTQALDGLYGKYGDASDAQATLTTGMAGLAGQITKGTDAVDLNTKAGAKNFQAFYQVSQQAQQYAEKLYEQTQNAGLANQSLQTSATNLDKVAAKAGLTKTQIQQLNIELYGVPDVKDITIKVDIGQAIGNIAQVAGALGKLAAPALHIGSTRAAGGPVQPGEQYLIGEEGPEILTFGASGFITPNNKISSMVSPSGGGSRGGSSGGITIQNLNISIPMQGFADFTNPNAMSVEARQQAIRIKNALAQVENSLAGASR